MNSFRTPGSPRPSERRIVWAVLGTLICMFLVFVALLALAIEPSFRFAKISARAMQIKLSLVSLSEASRMFYRDFGVWPRQLSELTNNPRNVEYYSGSLRDHWGRPFVYTPPGASNAPGLIGTFGADGLRNGDKSDGDFFFVITNEAPAVIGR